MDCVVIFENVMVPWERVFVCGDMARCNALYAETGAVVNMMHQVVVKNAVKSEFMLGLAARIAEVSDAMSLPHVRERLAEMIITTELMRSCLRAAEADAAPDKWGEYMPARPPLDTARNLFPKLYPRLTEIIQLNSSSSLMATPSERDFKSPIAPEILESTTQKSPCGVDSTRGARSRSCAGARDVHRSFGGFTCESAEMMRSFAIVAYLPGRLLTDPARPVHPGSGG